MFFFSLLPVTGNVVDRGVKVIKSWQILHVYYFKLLINAKAIYILSILYE